MTDDNDDEFWRLVGLTKPTGGAPAPSKPVNPCPTPAGDGACGCGRCWGRPPARSKLATLMSMAELFHGPGWERSVLDQMLKAESARQSHAAKPGVARSKVTFGDLIKHRTDWREERLKTAQGVARRWGEPLPTPSDISDDGWRKAALDDLNIDPKTFRKLMKE